MTITKLFYCAYCICKKTLHTSLIIALIVIGLVSALFLAFRLPRVCQHCQHFFHGEYLHRARIPGYIENTLPSIQAAYQQHIQNIELDVMMTKDQIPVLFHDKSFSIRTHLTKPLSDFSYQQLAALPLYDDQNKPHFQVVTTLHQALAFIKQHQMQVLLDIKHTDHNKLLAKAIVNDINALHAEKNVVISSFYVFFLHAVKSLDANLPIALTMHERYPGLPNHPKFYHWVAEKIFATFIGADLMEIHQPVFSKLLLTEYRKQGIGVIVYTVNDALDKQYLHKLHVAYQTDCAGIDKSCVIPKTFEN